MSLGIRHFRHGNNDAGVEAVEESGPARYAGDGTVGERKGKQRRSSGLEQEG